MREMKRLLFVVLMTVCSVSWAEWKVTGTTDHGQNSVYHDKSTIRRNGAISKMWTLNDYAASRPDISGREYKSVKNLFAYDCKEETSAITSSIGYDNSMGSGDVVYSHSLKMNQWEWDPISPGSVAAVHWAIACGKK
jgi:hypothetical protein